MQSSRNESAVSLIEVLIGLAIFAVALVPLMDLVTSSSRISVSARRLLEATLHGQTLLEALAELEPAEFPPVATGEERVILENRSTPSPGSGPRWQALATYCARPPPFEMQRRGYARRLSGGELAVRIELEFSATAAGDTRVQKITLQTLSTPRNWD